MTSPQAVDAVCKYLQVDKVSAEGIVARSKIARLKLDRKLQPFNRMPISRPESDAPAIVALTFSLQALRWLQEFSRTHSGKVFVLKTQLTQPYTLSSRQRRKSTELATAIEMIQSKSESNTIFVTFPDHCVGGARTSVRAPFFGEVMLFQAIESTLARKHGANMYCFNGEGLDRWRGEIAGKTAGADALAAEAAWIASLTEQAIRKAPDEFFGWERIESKSMHSLRRQHRMRLDVFEGFLRTWASRTGQVSIDFNKIIEQIASEGPALIEAEIDSAPLAGGKVFNVA